MRSSSEPSLGPNAGPNPLSARAASARSRGSRSSKCADALRGSCDACGIHGFESLALRHPTPTRASKLRRRPCVGRSTSGRRRPPAACFRRRSRDDLHEVREGSSAPDCGAALPRGTARESLVGRRPSTPSSSSSPSRSAAPALRRSGCAAIPSRCTPRRRAASPGHPPRTSMRSRSRRPSRRRKSRRRTTHRTRTRRRRIRRSRLDRRQGTTHTSDRPATHRSTSSRTRATHTSCPAPARSGRPSMTRSSRRSSPSRSARPTTIDGGTRTCRPSHTHRARRSRAAPRAAARPSMLFEPYSCSAPPRCPSQPSRSSFETFARRGGRRRASSGHIRPRAARARVIGRFSSRTAQRAIAAIVGAPCHSMAVDDRTHRCDEPPWPSRRAPHGSETSPRSSLLSPSPRRAGRRRPRARARPRETAGRTGRRAAMKQPAILPTAARVVVERPAWPTPPATSPDARRCR